MSEFFNSLLKGMLSFSIATLVIVVQPTVYADDLSDEAIQAELGLFPATLDEADLQDKKVAVKEEAKDAKKQSKPVLAAPGFSGFPAKKK